jgi:NAD(P)-dependent dehydrogenase (short-subunit alcohol dehydrogenase family)
MPGPGELSSQQPARIIGRETALARLRGLVDPVPQASTYDRLWDGNVRSAYLLVAALAPGMAQRGRGSIISVDSMAGHVGLVGVPPMAPARVHSLPCRGGGPRSSARRACG